LIFGWFHPLLKLGNTKGTLDPEDVATLPLPPDCENDEVVGEFDRRWEEEWERVRKRRAERGGGDDEYGEAESGGGAGGGPSLVRILALAFGRDFLRAGLLKMIHDISIFVGPQVLHGLITYMSDADAPLSRGLGLTAAVTLSQLAMSLALRHYFYKCYLTGLRVRTAVVSAVYRKALVLSASERQTRSAGEIVNLISVDAQRMQDLTTYLHAVWYSPLQIGLALYFLWGQLGVSCLGGVVVIVIMMPVTKWVARFLAKIQKDLMKAKDRRVEVNNEVLGSMKVVKLQAWEESFFDKIDDMRNAELRKLLKYKVVSAISIMLWSAVPLLVALATFATYVFLGNDLDVASALTALALFDILRFPLFMLPQIINRMVEASISFGRVRSFLLCEEHRPVGRGDLNEPGVRIGGNATFLYDGKKPRWNPDGDDDDDVKGADGGEGGGKGGKKQRKKKRRKERGPVTMGLRRDLHDANWEATLLRSRLADAESRIRELLNQKWADYGSAAANGGDNDNNDGGDGDGDGDEGKLLEEEQPLRDTSDYAQVEGDDDDPESPPSDLLSLKRLNFTVKRGELIAVVGGVGSGKSTLINAILGEVRPLCGDLAVNGKLAYFPQSPFVMNDTLKSNVVFGRTREPFDESRYRRAIRTCALEHDLRLLPDGDMTEIGEKGITLSGGQKARVAMARVVYRDADLYLLDDPLSAVDAHVGKHMFQKCVVEELLLGGRKKVVDANYDNGGAEEEERVAKAVERKAAVVLVTNALQYLSSPFVDRIVVLRDGAVTEQGTYGELSSDKNSVFSSFLSVMAETGGGTYGDASTEADAESLGDDDVDDDDEDDEDTDDDEGVSFEKALAKTDSANSLSALDVMDEPEVSKILSPRKELEDRASFVSRRDEDEDGDKDWPGAPPQRRMRSSMRKAIDPPMEQGGPSKPSSATPLMTDEFKERETGHVGLNVYRSWARAAGGAKVFVAILAAFAGTEGINVLSKWWLTYWSQHGGEGGSAGQFRFLAIYAAINLSAVVAVFVRLMLVMFTGLAASREMFKRLLEVVLEAPMSFFDTTPIGRIINRFSKDIYTIDEQLVQTLRSYLATLTSVVGVIIVVSTITPYFALCLLPMIFFYMHQQNYFTTTYRELKRLDSVSRSPIYALLGETLDGVSTIRAFSAQPSLLRRIGTMLDAQQNAYYLTCAAQCWLAVRLELVGTLIITFACLCAVAEHGARGGDANFAGLAGLSVSFALSVTQSLNWSVRMGSDLEANMVAVERVEQYCRIPGEAPRETDKDKRIDPKWPGRGAIKFRGARMRYRPGLPLVLKGLDLDIPARSKVGIVGRTGAGKSTLMVALLRIVELAGGSITIDDVDIRTLGLKKLRKQIAVIPQDPVLFSGSVRTNLDPFHEYTDERLYEVLTRVGLYGKQIRRVDSATSLASSHSGKSGGAGGANKSFCVKSISDEVFEGGSNFSVGQRQLLVIARALLCGARVVIMDEATASVDADTDARIQRVMRTEFRDATTLTVAHRINTIMDSDYILVMDDGRAAEFDTPGALMQIGGLFKDLVDAWEREHDRD